MQGQKKSELCSSSSLSLPIILPVTPWLQENRTNRWGWLFLPCASLSKHLTSTFQNSLRAVTPGLTYEHRLTNSLTHCHTWFYAVSQQLKTLNSKSKES